MVNKQGIWFLTLTGLILVLSVYYITIPNELLISTNGNYLEESDVTVSIKNSNTIDVMKSVRDEERLNITNELNKKLSSKDLSMEEKNMVYEELKIISKVKNIENVIEKKIKDKYNLESFVKIEEDVVEVVVINKKHDTSLAVKIMSLAQEEFKETMYVSVSFKEA